MSAKPSSPSSVSTFSEPSAASRPPGLLRLAALQTLRDFRAGELRLVLVAVLLAVAALTAVGFFADRLQRGLARDAGQLMGGDLVVHSDRPLPPVYEQRAKAAGLSLARNASFPSMARAPDELGGASRLVAVKAVSEGYPLRGELSLRESSGGPERKLAAAPTPGTVWADAAVLESLGLAVGERLWLGDAALTIARIIVIEPDRGTGFLSFAPRVMLHEFDLPATGLVQPASRVNYRLALVAAVGQEAALRDYADWARQTISAGARGLRVESLEAGRPEMRQTLDRADKFLNLVALLAALLAAVAVAIAGRDFAERHLDDCAMLRVLGLSQRRIAALYSLEFALLGLVASVAGVLLGLLVHGVFVELLGALVPASLPPPGLWPALFGVGVGLSLLLAFGLPPVLQLAQVPALRVIRRDLGGIRPASLGVLLTGLAGFGGLLMAVSRDLMLGAITVGGFAVAVGFFALLAWLAVWLVKRSLPRLRGPRWLVLAARQFASRPGLAVVQVASLAVGLMALALLVLLRTDLIATWRQSTPPDAPNRFIINIQPDQAESFQAALRKAGVQGSDWYPMIRGRLIRINGAPAAPRYEGNEAASRMVDREFNLSHSATLPSHNQLLAGAWGSGDAQGLSLEQGLANTLGLHLGDRLEFDIAGQLREVQVTSLRKVDWGSMRANFFAMFPLAEMPDLPATYFSAFKAPATPGFDKGLNREFPNITNVDLTATVAQVQQVLDQVISAVEYLFGFTLAAGLAVLVAATQASAEARAREYAVMRACGASGRLLMQVQRAELLGLGALAGALATGAAMAVGWALARWVFEFSWTPSLGVLLIGTATGAALALSVGWWKLRELLRRPVVETLRRAAQ